MLTTYAYYILSNISYYIILKEEDEEEKQKSNDVDYWKKNLWGGKVPWKRDWKFDLFICRVG